MKKNLFVEAATAIAMALLLCSCSNKAETASWYKAGASADASGSASSDADGIEDATLMHSAFSMGETVFYLGECTVQDLFNAGAVAYAEDNEDVTETGDASSSQNLVLFYNDEQLTVVTENRTGASCAVNDCTVIAAYFASTEFKAPGGLTVSNTISDFEEAYGEPFEEIKGEDISESYDGITAYYFVSEFAADAVCVFIDDESEYALSVRVSESTDYLTDLSELSGSFIEETYLSYFNENIDASGSEIYDVEGSDAIDAALSETTFSKVSLYTLNEIGDLDNYDLGTGELLDTTPNILLVFEYTQVYSYDKDERSQLSITDGVTLDAEYDVYGCFFIIDPCWVDGELESAVTETLVHSTGMVFTDEELMLEQIFYASDRGYDISAYTESSITEW